MIGDLFGCSTGARVGSGGLVVGTSGVVIGYVVGATVVDRVIYGGVG